MADFATMVSDWCHAVEGAVEAVFKESVQELAAVAQKPRREGGRMRIDTGFLRASLLASTSMMPPINSASKPAEGRSYVYSGQEITATIIGAELGQTIFLGYTAAYAAHREFGARGQAPDAFVRTAAMRWPEIVASKEAEFRSRLGL